MEQLRDIKGNLRTRIKTAEILLLANEVFENSFLPSQLFHLALVEADKISIIPATSKELLRRLVIVITEPTQGLFSLLIPLELICDVVVVPALNVLSCSSR